MADPVPPPVSWWNDSKNVILVLVAIGTLCNTIGQAIQGVLSSMHGQKLDSIGNVQAANTQKLDENVKTNEANAQKLVAVHQEVTATAAKADKLMTGMKK